MFTSIDRYLMRQVFSYLVAMTMIALLALLVERMLRLLELTQNNDQVVGYVSQMLVNLIPHYLGIALPAALFLAVYMTFSRLSRDRELTVMNASGISLTRLMIPVILFGFVLTLVAAVIFSSLQPYGRYTYRSLVYAIANASFSAAVKEGTFIHYEGRTFMVDGASSDGSQLRQIFVYSEEDDGAITVTTAAEGTLGESANEQRTILFLDSGTRATIGPDGRGEGVLAFQEFSWPIRDASVVTFRERGGDERELTLWELIKARESPPKGATEAQVIAELHSRLVRILSFFFMPLLAAPLALGGGRMGQSYGLVMGLVLLVVYEQLLQFGDAFVQSERFDPFTGLWLPFLSFAALSLFFFLRAAISVNTAPLGNLGEWLSRRIAWIADSRRNEQADAPRAGGGQ